MFEVKEQEKLLMVEELSMEGGEELTVSVLINTKDV